MNEEIREALKIINEPITVNCIEYKYFDEENYNKITNVYENCLWFANNLEQINLTVENLQKENKILKENAEHNDIVVDKVNWENQLLKKENQKLKEQQKEFTNYLKSMLSSEKDNFSVARVKDVLEKYKEIVGDK